MVFCDLFRDREIAEECPAHANARAIRGTARPEDTVSPLAGHDVRGRDETAFIASGQARLPAHLRIPRNAMGIIVFAPDCGDNRHSPNNQFVAEVLNRAGLGTLLVDLLTPDEEFFAANLANVQLLAQRLRTATDWLRRRSGAPQLPLGYFGAGAGAATALLATAEGARDVAAVVSSGGLPHLAGTDLPSVRAATLLIVGGRDEEGLELNRRTLRDLRCEKRLTIVPAATHLFEEPGTLQAVADLACDWFTRHLSATPHRTG